MRYLYIIALIGLMACAGETAESEPEEFQPSFDTEFYDNGERIDGPANLRDEPDGKVLLELENNALIDIENSDAEWLQIGFWFYMPESFKEGGVIPKNSDLLSVHGDKIGKTLVDMTPDLMQKEEEGWTCYQTAYTHRDNIQKESVVEVKIAKYIANHGRRFDDWLSLIEQLDMKEDNRFLFYEGFYCYENWITDPSPGFRILLLFDKGDLKGIFHSRPLVVEEMKTWEIEGGDQVSFFKDYPEDKQVEFVEYMREWLQGVD